MFGLDGHTIGLVGVGLLGFLALIVSFRYPEIILAFFILSYIIEGGVLLPWFLNLTLIFLAIVVLGFTALVAMGKKDGFKLRLGDLLLFAFLVLLFGGSYLVQDIAGGLIKALRFTGGVFLPYLITRVFVTKPAQIRRFLKTVFNVAVIVAIVFLIISYKEGISGRMPFFEASTIPVATLFAVGLVLAVIEVMMSSWKTGRVNKILHVATIPVFLYNIFLTGLRGPLIAAVVGLTFFFFVGFVKKITPRFRVTAVATLVLIIGSFYYYGDILPNIYAYSQRAVMGGLSTLLRFEQYSLVRDLFLQNPLLGVGTSGFGQLTGWPYPHNIFAEVAVETGLIGLVCFSAFLGTVAWYGFRFLTSYYPLRTELGQKTGLMILVVSLLLLTGRQFSFGLDMQKELFVFLALVVNLPIITRSRLMANSKIKEQ